MHAVQQAPKLLSPQAVLGLAGAWSRCDLKTGNWNQKREPGRVERYEDFLRRWEIRLIGADNQTVYLSAIARPIDDPRPDHKCRFQESPQCMK